MQISNTECERVISKIGLHSAANRNRMSISTLQCLLTIKTNAKEAELMTMNDYTRYGSNWIAEHNNPSLTNV